MKKVNSLSGGKTSSYIAVHYPADYEVFSLVCIDDVNSKPKDKSIIKYVNDKLQKFTNRYGEFIATAEDDKTLHAMRDLEQLIGREIIWVRGKSFDNVVGGSNGRLPSYMRRFCTVEMKLEPIFWWWYQELSEVCEMRIGFRFDEFKKRMEKFFNNSNPTMFRVPISTNIYGKRRQNHQSFKWRYCSFPLIQDGVIKSQIDEFWANKKIGGNLFEEESYKKRNELTKARRKVDKEYRDKLNSYTKKYENGNKKKIYERVKRNRAKSDNHKKYVKEYSEKNREARKEYSRKYIRTEMGKAVQSNHRQKRRAKLKDTNITSQWLKELMIKSKMCPICSKKMKKKSLDHIIPLNVGGLHTMFNVRVICNQCNMKRPKNGSDEVQYRIAI